MKPINKTAGPFQTFRLHRRNAKMVIGQIKRGEWDFIYNPMTNCCCVARRGIRELWVGNEGFFCDVDGMNAFGLIFRHWVWLAAARKSRQVIDRQNRHLGIPDLSN